MTIIDVALLGAGRMGQIHLANMMRMNHVKVRYIYDPHYQQHDDRHTNDLERVLGDDKIKACVIAAPSSYHETLIDLCVSAQKHVFCEKPISFESSRLKAIKHRVEQSGITLQVGFNRRFDPSLAQLREEVGRGSVGNIHLIKITNRDPLRPRLDFVRDSGGLFFDFNVHDFDMLRFITGDQVEEVYAVGDALIEPALKEYGDIDTAVITAKMSSGALAVIDCSRESGYGYDQQLEVFGDRAMFRITNQTKNKTFFQDAVGGRTSPLHYSFVERYSESYRVELEEFFAHCATINPPLPNIDDAIAAVRIARASVISLNEGRPVSLMSVE